MFKYEFVEVTSEITGFGIFVKGIKTEFKNYQEIITNRAASGWRYVGFMPKRQSDAGNIEIMDLIFEKEED